MLDRRAPLPQAFTTIPVRRARLEGGVPSPEEWGVITETAIEIGFNGRPAAVMMATPADIEDFAIGFAMTEELIADTSAISDMSVEVFPEGVTIDIRIKKSALRLDRLRKRLLEGRTGCGLCGIESLSDAVRKPQQVENAEDIPPATILKAFDQLPAHQPLNGSTKSAHVAALCEKRGDILLAREDVGRHNALDKLIGAGFRQNLSFSDGFVVMSSRCSFELVQKAAIAGAPLLATVSAPTEAALSLARYAGLKIACLDGGDIITLDEIGA